MYPSCAAHAGFATSSYEAREKVKENFVLCVNVSCCVWMSGLNEGVRKSCYLGVPLFLFACVCVCSVCVTTLAAESEVCEFCFLCIFSECASSFVFVSP